jgi:hypothetical protein
MAAESHHRSSVRILHDTLFSGPLINTTDIIAAESYRTVAFNDAALHFGDTSSRVRWDRAFTSRCSQPQSSSRPKVVVVGLQGYVVVKISVVSMGIDYVIRRVHCPLA